MKSRMEVSIAGVTLKNPVMDASGTFGNGREYEELIGPEALRMLGAIVTKGVSGQPWEGNATPRVAETPSGMLNAIGLQNPGIDVFVRRELPFLKEVKESSGTRVIVNVCGHSVEEYLSVIERLHDEPVDLLEINVSCPNVKQGAIAFGQDPKMLERVTRAVKDRAGQPVMMKLTPNVTDIRELARAAEAGGADAISLINTLTGMKIDVHRRRFVLANRTGGLSGPAIHPVAVRMVYEAAHAVSLPVIGMGGIQSWEDAVEMILAGATAVAVGTATFHNPQAMQQIIRGIEEYLELSGVADVNELIGAVKD
ncbi:MAG: dihydroorotate dehydrogenase [Lachnospiraceae bacterium]|nr:dihydroorotate dehydrogenase [Lachnospiraceae bacterium]